MIWKESAHCGQQKAGEKQKRSVGFPWVARLAVKPLTVRNDPGSEWSSQNELRKAPCSQVWCHRPTVLTLGRWRQAAHWVQCYSWLHSSKASLGYTGAGLKQSKQTKVE